ncbi:MAG: hypothetical protein AAGF32_00200 [Pseudomonadota bacterium]
MFSIRALPLLVIPFLLYNMIAFGFGISGQPSETFASELFSTTMPSGAEWVFTTRDLIMVITLMLLAVEMIKASYVSRGAASLTDQALSLVLFVVCLIQFLLVDVAATSLFLLITLTSAIDVVTGAIISVQTARRDFGFGGAQ